MAEFEEKLNAILSDPQAMGQIASLAQALTGDLLLLLLLCKI